MFTWNFLRLNARPPEKGPPRSNFVDLFYDPETGKVHAKNAADAEVLFNAAGSSGPVTTDSLVTSDGSAAAAVGGLGEYMEATVEFASRVALTTLTAKSIANITLTPGNWDVEGMITFVAVSATMDIRTAEVNATADVQTLGTGTAINGRATVTTSETISLAIPRRQYLVTAGSYPVYLTALVNFSAGTVSAYGRISARRVR